jgi:hypothetical protein
MPNTYGHLLEELDKAATDRLDDRWSAALGEVVALI